MTTKEELIRWNDGVYHYSVDNLEDALDSFTLISDYAKVAFNIGMVYLKLQNHQMCIEFFSRSIEMDPYLAGAYFQRAYSHFLLEEYEFAEEDYSLALELLLDNESIDYTQIGMKYRLYRCEVLFNRGITRRQLGDNDSSVRDILEAQRCQSTSEQKEIIDPAARQGISELTLFAIPLDAIFTASESKMKNLDRKNHLKQAKIVSSKDDELEYEGFTGAGLLKRDKMRQDDDLAAPTVLSGLRKKQTIKNTGSFEDLTSYSMNNTQRRPTLPRKISSSKLPTPPTSPNDMKFKPMEDDVISMHSGKGSTHIMPRNSSVKPNSSPTSPTNNKKPTWAAATPPTAQLTKKPSWGSNTSGNDDTRSVKSDKSQSAAFTGKLKIKVHYEKKTIALLLYKESISLDTVLRKICDKLRLYDQPALTYLDEDDGTKLSIHDDEDMEMALETGHVWVTGGDGGVGNDIYDLY